MQVGPKKNRKISGNAFYLLDTTSKPGYNETPMKTMNVVQARSEPKRAEQSERYF